MEQPIGKGRVQWKGGGEGVGADFTVCLKIDILWSMGIGQPYASADLNPTL